MTTEEQVKIIIEKAQISDLLTRYFAAIDDKRLDKKIVEATFSKDAEIVRPDDVVIIGPDNIFNAHKKSFDRFKATHHLFSNFLIDISSDNATLRANLIANHIWKGKEDDPSLDGKYFLADGVFYAKAKKNDNTWLIYELRNRVVWRTGDGMAEMIKSIKQ
jgi:SnoaL-like domain